MAKNSKKTLPTTAEIFMGVRSEVALSAIFRSGGGLHKDKRKARKLKHSWRRELSAGAL